MIEATPRTSDLEGVTSGPATSRTHGGSASIRLVGSDRVLAVLSELATHPEGVSLDELSRAVRSPKPTVHRALASLRRAGFAGLDGRGTYVLGDEFLRLAFDFHEARPAHVRVAPVLTALADLFGETSHYAVLDGAEIVYRAKVDPAHGAIRLSSVIGGRNPAHCTAAGKLLLAFTLEGEQQLEQWVAEHSPLEQRTARSPTELGILASELEKIRGAGYATEDEENETGISCLAVPVYLSSASVPDGAISISAVAYRTPLSELEGGLERILEVVAPLQIRAAS